jgi:hypothetical protein
MKPMAIVIAFGLSFSTLITLVLVPVVYTIFDDLGNRMNKRFSKVIGRIKKLFIKSNYTNLEI